MLETSARLLKLLSLLQTPREWTGTELAERLGVSGRTVRNDVDRLRQLGYPVNATRGAIGGYRLGAGANLPPLLLDDEEAVAVALGLRTAVTGSIAGIEESSLRALSKLERVLPSRLRHRVNTLQTYTVPVMPDRNSNIPKVTAELLTIIAKACQDRERLWFDYAAHDGTSSRRDAEPYRLVNWGKRWYLFAWDTQRKDWRTYRVDRIELKTPNGPRFTPRDLPTDDIAEYVARGVSGAVWRYRAKVIVHEAASTVAERLPSMLGPVEAIDENTCTLNLGSDNPENFAVWIGLLGADFTIVDAPELVEQLRIIADRYRRAVESS